MMEAGASYNKQRLHKARYFRELLATNPDIPEGLRALLRLCRETVVRLFLDCRCHGAVIVSTPQDALEGKRGEPYIELIKEFTEHPNPTLASFAVSEIAGLRQVVVEVRQSARKIDLVQEETF